ncbi:MAG: DUF3800 domain-containing protein [Roseovarius sp.]
MTHTYLAFIDESGDDGLGKPFRQPGGRGGPSRWLVISACVFRNSMGLEAVRWRDEINALMPDRKKRELHFANLNHGQKLASVSHLAKCPVRALSILANKETIPEGVYTEKNQLYFYMTRYLIERISWLCRDHRPNAPEGDGRVAITFSRRGGMQYDSFRNYLSQLKANQDGDVRVHWPVIDVEGVSAEDHSKSASLQLADIVASAFASGLELDMYGNCEPRYSEILKPVTYNRKKNFLSYGVKLVPNYKDCPLNEQQLRMISTWE